MPLDAEDTADGKRKPVQVSNGLGRTTCPYFLPGDSVVVFASTHAADSACPEVPERGPEGRYVWPIYDSYDMYLKNLNTGETTAIAVSDTYDAEATVSPKGDRMVFTSTRDGDLDLYTCDLDGQNVVRVTSELGYDGGAFFSPDGEWLVWRASRPSTPEDIAKYKDFFPRAWWNPPAWNCSWRARTARDAPNHRARRRQLGPVLPPRRQADPVLVQPRHRPVPIQHLHD